MWPHGSDVFARAGFFYRKFTFYVAILSGQPCYTSAGGNQDGMSCMPPDLDVMSGIAGIVKTLFAIFLYKSFLFCLPGQVAAFACRNDSFEEVKMFCDLVCIFFVACSYKNKPAPSRLLFPEESDKFLAIGERAKINVYQAGNTAFQVCLAPDNLSHYAAVYQW